MASTMLPAAIDSPGSPPEVGARWEHELIWAMGIFRARVIVEVT